MLMVAIFVSYERFSCLSKSYELCVVQANILVLDVLECSLVIALVFLWKFVQKQMLMVSMKMMSNVLSIVSFVPVYVFHECLNV